MQTTTAPESERTATIPVTSPSRLTTVSDQQGSDIGVDRLAEALPVALDPGEILRPARRLAGARQQLTSVGRSRRDRLSPLAARPLAPVVVWALCAGAALATTEANVRGAAGAGIAGVLVSLFLLRGAVGGRVVTAAAMAPVMFAGSAPNVAWVLAGILVAGVAASSERPLVARSQDLQRHLDWCRRREEHAHVLVVRMPESEAGDDRRLLEAFRLTDSVAITHGGGRCEIQAVVDDHRLSRAGLERRVVQEVGAGAQFGWAAFPADGFTLDVLLERAASGLALGTDEPAGGLGRLEPVHQPA